MTVAPLIHVGYQKTASTFLQHHVFNNEDVFFAPWGTQSAEAIEAFVLAHPERFDPDEVRRQFVAPSQRVPLISHEDLLGYPVYGRYYAESTVRRIASAFPDAKILVCIREQRAMLLSNYFQYIRQGGTSSLLDLLRGAEERPGFRPDFRLDHFEYDLTYSILRKHFDPEQILMLPMELLRSDQPGFLARLNGFIGVSQDWDSLKQTIANRRSSPTALRVERFLNGVLPNPAAMPADYADYPARVRLRYRLVRYVDRFTADTKSGASYLQKLQDQIARHVGDYFDTSNRKTIELTGVDLAALNYRVAEG